MESGENMGLFFKKRSGQRKLHCSAIIVAAGSASRMKGVDKIMAEIGVRPPHFVIFCNDARLFHFSYQRYLENQIRDTFGMEGTPIRLTIRQKGEKEEE